MTPGSEGKNKVVEVTFQVHKLSSDSASLGKAKVLKKLASATATVGPKKRRRGKGETYKLHRLQEPVLTDFITRPRWPACIRSRSTSPMATAALFLSNCRFTLGSGRHRIFRKRKKPIKMQLKAKAATDASCRWTKQGDPR